ncbi:unnamed protein product [Brassica oleracea var. botrytis]
MANEPSISTGRNQWRLSFCLPKSSLMEYALNDEISMERENGRKMKRKRILSHKKKSEGD